MATTTKSTAKAIPEIQTPEAPKPAVKATRTVFVRPEYEGQTALVFTINGVPLTIPTDTEVEVPEDYAKLVGNYKAAREESRNYRLANEARVQNLMRG